MLRAGFPVYKDGKEIGYVTSGTMIPRYVVENQGSLLETFTDQKAMRSIGLALLDSDVLTDDVVEVDIRGSRISRRGARVAYAFGDAPPYARTHRGGCAGGTEGQALRRPARSAR